ncbi:hypothetical protein OG455_17545 [Kitasatospora sp. NBC_01287]|uniref:hypothetical protein n=1 Tax=Kitasatospora sp. NBC_01287 TaxID=2903573 RepID=UPI0022597781|nr:hypothetical protein [Kitasatospora sp. NBC_01287]MCX4747303.1 hypothetical protein [Kitasatospora sp. NBC_01287]
MKSHDHPTHTPPPPVIERGLPECECPAECGGRPELFQRLAPAYPTVDPYTSKPPEHPHLPSRRGELVHDTLNNRSGVVMDRTRDLVYLRPERGGQEWDVDVKWLVKPS